MITSKADVNPPALRGELERLASRLNLRSTEEARSFPKFFYLETVRICNARCPFCAIDQWDKSVPFLSDELFEKFIQEVADFSEWVYQVNIQKAGEPLLDKKIGPRIRRLKEVGVRHVSMSTNASLLNEKRAREILEAGVDDVMLSIDSIEKENYQKMRVGLRYETVMRNIYRFFEIRDQIRAETVIRVRGVSFHDKRREDEIREFDRWNEFWRGLRKPQDRVYMKRPHSWSNQKFWDGHTPKYEWVYHPCIIPWSTFSIHADGKVPFCPQDYDAKLPMGDFARQSIVEIWKGEGFSRVRNLHASGNRNELAYCRGCMLFDPEFSEEKDKPVLPI